MTYKSVSLLTIKWLFLHTRIHVGECYKNICAAKTCMYILQNHDIQISLLVDYQRQLFLRKTNHIGK